MVRLLAFQIVAVLLGISASLVVTARVEADSGAKRVALVITNENYPDADPSVQADEDATTLAAELKADGFAVEIKKNLSKQDMQSAIDAFVGKIAPKMTALFYYKGIGIQTAHQSFLIPVNADIWSESDVKREGISIDSVMNEVSRKGAGVKIAIIDGARVNPFERRFRSYSAGLAGLDAPEGSLVIYAEAPNKVGKSSSGSVSLFMSELIKQMKQPDATAEEVFTRTRIRVSKASNGEQVPWMASSLIEQFSFGASKTPPSPPVVVKPQVITPKPVVVEQPKPQVQQPQVIPPQKPIQAPPVVQSENVQPPEKPEPPKLPPVLPAPVKPQGSIPKPVLKSFEPGSTFSDCPDCPEMSVLPGGTFTMGSGKTPIDRPAHSVTIAKPFAIGRTEVTFDNWNACADDSGCKHRPDTKGFGGADRPVINVSWSDAKEYVAWLSKKTGKTYRLPSEAEWEYAAHGKTDTLFAWGNEVGTGLANCADCGDKSAVRKTDRVKSFPPNGFGLYDMAGNVAEWVEDCWTMNYRGAPRDGSAVTTGSCESRVLRGGSFDSTSAYIKPTARFRYDADVPYWANGFRVAREIP